MAQAPNNADLSASPAQAPATISSTRKSLVELAVALETNPATCCTLGQEAVQDLIESVTGLYKVIKMMQLPGEQTSSHQEFINRRSITEEHLNTINKTFECLRHYYDCVVAATNDLAGCGEELLPFEGTWAEHMLEQNSYSNPEHQHMAQMVELRVKHLREIMDSLRTCVTEINTMVGMQDGSV